MKKREFIKSGLLATGGFGLFGATSLLSTVTAHANTSIPSHDPEFLKEPSNFTVPSWTLYQRARKKGISEAVAVNLLVPKERPYNIAATFNGDPTTRMGITWYTNEGQTGQYLEYVKGELKGGASDEGFFKNATRVAASGSAGSETPVNGLIYNNAPNIELTGKTTRQADGTYTMDEDENRVFDLYSTRNYVSHKVLLTGLTPDTTYTYRVGKEGHFRIGTFRTARANKDSFKFIYIADTQAMNEDYFDASTRTVTAAAKRAGKDAAFLLCAGDHVESNQGPAGGTGLNGTYYEKNSEWEWEQWFERMQDTWLRLPVVPVQGNHDTAVGYNNMYYHFNTDKSYNEAFATGIYAGAKTDMDGTVYSFVCGDALFMVINFEDSLKAAAEGSGKTYAPKDEYFAGLQAWMREQIAANPDVKWRIITYHKTLFTGSFSHQDDEDSRIVREKMASFFEEVGIDLALQGHDHIYEAIGVITAQETTYSLVENAVTGQDIKPIVVNNATTSKPTTDSMTGKHGGVFDVKKGMVYFLNNSAGKKKYYPRNEQQMKDAIGKHGVTDYFQMFNKFGQQDKPTFSEITVSSDEIKIETYEVAQSDGAATLFDTIKVVRSGGKATAISEVTADSETLKILSDGYRQVRLEAPGDIIGVRMYAFTGAQVIAQKSNTLNLAGIATGVYLLNVQTTSGVYTERFIVKP